MKLSSFTSLARQILHDPGQIPRITRTAVEIYRNGGLPRLRQRIFEKSIGPYRTWYAKYAELSALDREKIRARIEQLPRRPLISVLMPVYNIEERYLREAVESVQAQLYPHWELCIADDHSPNPRVREVLREYEAKDRRIQVVYREENGRIAAASNSALEIVHGEYTSLLDHDDVLTEHALYLVAEEICARPDADLIYSDEDKLNLKGELYDPYFKPDWNPDLFYSENFINHLGTYRTSLLKELGGFRTGFDGSQDYDLALRVIEKSAPERIRHIPFVLYHWRAIPGSVALGPMEKSYAHENARKAIREHFARTGRTAEVTEGFGPHHRVIYPLPDSLPKVSAIICTRDKKDLLEQTVRGLLEETDYPNLEILIIDNQSEEPETLEYLEQLLKHGNIRALKYDAPFNFSAMNNLGAREAQGEVFAILNNDLRIIHRDWLTEMVRHALRPEVGAVGAKLYYGDGRVQHAGIVLGIGGIASHPFRFFPHDSFGFAGGRCRVIQQYSAVTGACMVIRKDVFEKLEGFDEEDFPVAYNDVDFCLRARKQGFSIIFTPHAELYHLESASRGSDTTEATIFRFMRERNQMWNRWNDWIMNDPFYNLNHSIMNDAWEYANAPRVIKPWLPN